MPCPSGRQVLLARGAQQLVVVEVGGGIRHYSVAGEEVLDGYGEDDACDGGRGQVLAPWPNRLGDGSFEWASRVHQVPLSEPENHNAIHGLVRWASWGVALARSDRAILAHRLHPQPGWPWTIDLAVTYRLSDAGLEVRTSATNLSAEECPFGAGWHPYLRAFGHKSDTARLTVPAGSAYRCDGRGLPSGRFDVSGTPLDFQAGRTIGASVLDTAYTDLRRGPDGRCTAELRDPASGRWARLWCDEAYTHLMVFTGDTLGDRRRRRDAVAIEPMTAAPDMLRSGDGRRVLAPGETFEATWGLEAGRD